MKTNVLQTAFFKIPLDANMEWFPLKRPAQEVYRIRYLVNDTRYAIEISVLEKEASAEALAQRQFEANQYSTFSGENIPPHIVENQQHGLTAWGCRYRWVNGGVAPYKMHHVFVQMENKVIHFAYMAAPDEFDEGFVAFLRLVLALEPG